MVSVLVLLGLCFTSVIASDVLEFTNSNFDDKAKDLDIALIEFYAPWCGHCKRLAPEYEKAATKLKDNDPPVPLVKVDCTTEKETCDRFGVSGFPTLKIFRNGEFSADYSGPREADGIIKYMRGQAGPSSKELTSVAEIERFVGADEHAIIGFFEKETKLKDAFLKVADAEREKFRFAHTTNADIIKKYGYADDIVIFSPKHLQSKFEDAQLKYTGNYDTDKIKKFLRSDLLGLCGHRQQDNTDMFEKPLVVVYYNVDYAKDPKGTNYWRNRIFKVATEKLNKKIKFAISNRDEFSHELDEYGMEKDSKTPVVAGQGPNGEKYKMEGDFSLDALAKFAQDLLDGKLEPYLKSEAIPENNDGPVKVLVAKNFKDEVTNSGKDALVEFYAPWCGHCKKLVPVYDELGEKMAKEDVVIAKMDATANDVPPGFDVRGFPTIYWIPKGKSPVVYNGGRELKDFVKYISAESTDGLKGFDRKGKKIKKEL